MAHTIRRATQDDLDLVAPLFDAYRQFYAQPSDLQRARDWLRERLQHGDPSYCSSNTTASLSDSPSCIRCSHRFARRVRGS